MQHSVNRPAKLTTTSMKRARPEKRENSEGSATNIVPEIVTRHVAACHTRELSLASMSPTQRKTNPRSIGADAIKRSALMPMDFELFFFDVLLSAARWVFGFLCYARWLLPRRKMA